MSFPNYKKNWLGIRKPYGWKDLGEVFSSYKDDKKILFVHNVCQRISHVGKEDNEIFRFCPLCLVKLIFEVEKK